MTLVAVVLRLPMHAMAQPAIQVGPVVGRVVEIGVPVPGQFGRFRSASVATQTLVRGHTLIRFLLAVAVGAGRFPEQVEVASGDLALERSRFILMTVQAIAQDHP